MPATRSDALAFLETQWSSINDNKVNGILAEVRFKAFLEAMQCQFISGGLLLVPGNPSIASIPMHAKICVLPRPHSFTWNPADDRTTLGPADLSAYNYFRQAGIMTYFASPARVDESAFAIPTKKQGKAKAAYPRPYALRLSHVGQGNDLKTVDASEVFTNFPRRSGQKGLRCNEINRLDRSKSPWNSADEVAQLFWFAYVRYYFHIDYLIANNDLDLFLIGPSGKAFPVELKSKSPAADKSVGEWFGIDIGPFAKLSFFKVVNPNNDALFIVEEVDANKNHVEWFGIRLTDLLRACSWVGQAGGRGMGGGLSATYKIPKAAFTKLIELLPQL
jgi:hypothetical protein